MLYLQLDLDVPLLWHVYWKTVHAKALWLAQIVRTLHWLDRAVHMSSRKARLSQVDIISKSALSAHHLINQRPEHNNNILGRLILQIVQLMWPLLHLNKHLKFLNMMKDLRWNKLPQDGRIKFSKILIQQIVEKLLAASCIRLIVWQV